MKPVSFGFKRAHELGQAIALMSEACGEARFLAGGQSLMPMLNLRLAQPKLLIDITGVAALKKVAISGRHHHVGACITSSEIEDGLIEGMTGRYLSDVAAGIAYRGIRNQGTIGGSIAHADPSADWPAALLGLSAVVVATGLTGERQIPITEFYRSPFVSELSDDELLTEIILPVLSDEARWGYYKVAPKLGEFAEAIGVAVHDRTNDFYALAVGATDSVPLRIATLEDRWREDPAGFPIALSVGEVRREITKLGLVWSSYKAHCLSVAVKRAMVAAVKHV